ncbi:MAG: TonB-dependent receptor [Crocinitomicaceae bacterium]|nr:TonB-dependent receptor [Crocinitomicaceae bacterium]
MILQFFKNTKVKTILRKQTSALKITSLLVTLLLSSNDLLAQKPAAPGNGILRGIVIDSVARTGIDYASVRLLSVRDSLTLLEVYTDDKGVFRLEQIPNGKYFVKITFFGYVTKVIDDISFSADSPGRDLGLIRIAAEVTTNLDEIQVVAKQEIMLNTLDKKVYNVGEDLASKGGTVNDLLNNIPSIEVDQDGTISLRGNSNVTVLIDGRPSTLTGGNGKSLLDAFPAGSIERIEVVNNPSAKYDPDGTSGIINIVLKKNKLRGINGNVAMSAGTGNDYSGSASLSYRNVKMNAFATYALSYYEGQRGNESRIIRNFADSIFKLNQNRTGTDLMVNHTARIGSDFYIKPRNTFGVVLTGNFGDRKRTGNMDYMQLGGNDVSVREWNRLSEDPSKNQNFDLNLNYKWDFKAEKGNVTFDVTHSAGFDNSTGDYDESYISENGVPVYQPHLQQNLSGDDKFRVSTIQSDYTKILPKNIRIEAGAKGVVRQSTVVSASGTKNQVTNEFEMDTLSNFTYQYDEQIFSAYGNFGQQIKKFKYQGGVRLEQAMQAPNLVSQNQSFKNNYFNFFPSAFLAYEINKESEVTLSYSRRINRPSSWNLNPFTSYADPFNLRKGNPNLKPEYINSLDLGYGFNKKNFNLTANVYYRQTTDVIQRVKEFYDNGSTAATYGNINESRSLGTELILVYKPFPWFRNVISLNGNRIQYIDDSPTTDFNNTGFNWGAKYTGSFEFWKKTANIQVNGRYNAPIVTAQGTVLPRASVDLSGNKTLKNGKWTVGFRFADIFNTREFVIEVEQPTAFQYSRFKQNTRRFYINASYKFGKYDVSKKSKVYQAGDGGGEF